MSNFSQDFEIAKNADNAGVHRVLYALQNHTEVQAKKLWGAPEVKGHSSVDYGTLSIGSDCVTGKYAKALANTIQFPESSAFLHALGCVSAAMSGRFTCEYNGSQEPTNLYTIVSQPPSSGKSAINKALTEPMSRWVMGRNERVSIERKALRQKMMMLKDEMKEVRKSGNTSSISRMAQDYAEMEEKDAKLKPMAFPITESTPEGLFKENYEQGVFHLITDEAGGLEGLIMSQYSDSKKTNQDLLLKAWDGGLVNSSRSSRDSMTTYANGVIVCIAQTGMVGSLIDSGAMRANGLAERFLMIEEPNLLGKRVHGRYKEIPAELKRGYESMINEILGEQSVSLSFCDEAIDVLIDMRNKTEKSLGDGGERSSGILRGSFGKADKQIMRIASVLHVSREWSGSRPGKGRVVSLQTFIEAMAIFNEIYNAVESIVERRGYTGTKAQAEDCEEILASKSAGIVPKMPLAKLVKEARKKKSFTGASMIEQTIVNRVIPELQRREVAVMHNGFIYVNPGVR